MRISPHQACVAATIALATASTSRAQCLEWDDRFGPPGTNNSVRAMTAFDDGSGNAVYLGGSFTIAGNVLANSVVKFDGANWSAFGDGLEGSVRALAHFDDGSGPALYAGGSFRIVTGGVTDGIARWTGSSWSAPAGGTTSGSVNALIVFDDGAGPALYAGGSFTSIGGVAASRMARWDGSSWSALGAGLDGPVLALSVFDDGTGPALFVGGSFTDASGTSVGRVAKWNGATWSDMGGGVEANVNALAVFDDGRGPALYAGGAFKTAGGESANNIARWNGTSWSPLGSGTKGTVQALTTFDDGTVAVLCAGGDFNKAGGVLVSDVAKWDGSTWSELSNGVSSAVSALLALDLGAGPRLYAGGAIAFADNEGVNCVAEWDGSSWSAVWEGHGMGLPVGGYVTITSFTVFDDGSGPALYAGGPFRRAGTETVTRIAKWNGTNWSSLGSGFSTGYIPTVHALAAFDDGGGPKLYAAGDFQFAGPYYVKRVAKWDGVEWTNLGNGVGIQSFAYALAVFDDGSGPALYTGGSFSISLGAGGNGITRWNGSAWSEVGGGTSGSPRTIKALTVFDDGSGEALYAAGDFTVIGGTSVNRIAKWNGTNWSDVGGGVTTPGSAYSRIDAMHVFDDGSGPALFAAGDFLSAGGTSTSRIAKWNGTSWSALGTGLDRSVRALTSFHDGVSSALYAAGWFTTAGGVPARSIAKWNGTSWSSLGEGITGVAEDAFGLDGMVHALAVFDDGVDGAPDLYLGGSFNAVGDTASVGIAQWHGCPVGDGYCFGDGVDPLVTAQCPCANFGDEGRGCANSNAALGGARLIASGTTNPNTILFNCAGIPDNNLCTFLRGSSSMPSGATFGDGIKCVSGALVRFGQQQSGQGGNASNTVTAVPATVAPGNTRYYQVQYRNPAPAFCPPETFNSSNAYRIDW